jgi:hypothetical protein
LARAIRDKVIAEEEENLYAQKSAMATSKSQLSSGGIQDV